MSAAVMRRLAATGAKLDRDVIFAAVADDEHVPVAGLAWGVEVLDAVVREISRA